MTFICYPKCTTCQKAKRWLDENQITYDLRDIKLENPTYDELSAWYQRSGLPLKKCFNTSGLLYKSMELKDKLQVTSLGATTTTVLPIRQENAENQMQAIEALTMLGFAPVPSKKVVLKILESDPNMPVEQIVKQALKML